MIKFQDGLKLSRMRRFFYPVCEYLKAIELAKELQHIFPEAKWIVDNFDNCGVTTLTNISHIRRYLEEFPDDDIQAAYYKVQISGSASGFLHVANLGSYRARAFSPHSIEGFYRDHPEWSREVDLTDIDSIFIHAVLNKDKPELLIQSVETGNMKAIHFYLSMIGGIDNNVTLENVEYRTELALANAFWSGNLDGDYLTTILNVAIGQAFDAGRKGESVKQYKSALSRAGEFFCKRSDQIVSNTRYQKTLLYAMHVYTKTRRKEMREILAWITCMRVTQAMPRDLIRHVAGIMFILH